MTRNELERAWPAAEPPPGFSERVIDRLQQEPARVDGAPSTERALRRRGTSAWLPAQPRRWLALPALALALGLGGVFVLESTRPSVDGEVIAAEPRVVSIGERAIAELSSGAHVRWSGDEVRQSRGEVTYRVEPGAPFAVQTPYGSVAVLGTVFRVVVADVDPNGGEPVKKQWAIAGGATLGALLLVSVERGSVRLSAGEHHLEVGAGQTGSVGSDGMPRRDIAASNTPSAPDPAQVEAERKRNRQVADAVRRHAARRREAAARAATSTPEQPAAQQPPSQPAPPIAFGPYRDGPPPEPTPEEARRREYIKRTVREQYIPVARECYGELLARQPTAAGRVTLEFDIVGDGDAGVVDRVSLRDQDDGEDSIEDPEFRLCMTESMYTAVFEPPPPGTNETTVVYPVMLAPE
jgi:ferric-dicitrate binding protein FerR (iron transport regulator)